MQNYGIKVKMLYFVKLIMNLKEIGEKLQVNYQEEI